MMQNILLRRRKRKVKAKLHWFSIWNPKAYYINFFKLSVSSKMLKRLAHTNMYSNANACVQQQKVIEKHSRETMTKWADNCPFCNITMTISQCKTHSVLPVFTHAYLKLVRSGIVIENEQEGSRFKNSLQTIRNKTQKGKYKTAQLLPLNSLLIYRGGLHLLVS